ncbi:MAG: CHASE2 domain-containing protein [Cyanobacteria bacterium J06634_5]
MRFIQRFGRNLGGNFGGRLRGLNQMMPGLVASTLVIALMKLSAWTPLERVVTTQLIRLRGSRDWDSRIVMVSVDDKTLGEFGQFPISRDYYADLVWLLTREESSVIAFNMLLSGNTAASGSLQANSDATARLASAMSSHGRVVIGQTWGSGGEMLSPVPVLANTAITTGHLRLSADPDAITRSINIVFEDLSALGVAAIQAYGIEKELVSIPEEPSGMLYLNWPGEAKELATFSLVDVLAGQFPPGYLKDKIVIVDYGAASSVQPLRTPFDSQATVSGGYMHAAVIDNLLNQNWLHLVPEQGIGLSLLIVGPIFSWLLYRREGWVQVTAGVGLSVGWVGVCFGALYWNYLLPVVTPLVAIAMIDAAVIVLSRLQSNALLQVRSAFLNTMSHEIRTPLNAIVNLSEMLQETPLNERQREFTDTLNHSSQTLLALINDVLDFSKIESGRLMLEEYPVTLSDTLERSIEIVAPRAAEKGLELTYLITPTTPAIIMSDPVRLQQILLNLLSNAVKFTEAGEISVQLQAAPLNPPSNLFSIKRWHLLRRLRAQLLRWQTPQPQTPDGGAASGGSASMPKKTVDKRDRYEIRFAVSDTGIGIPSEQISQLFQPFSQVSAATTRQYGGTGLGLSISKRLSERMGGNLWVRSRLGEGSTFYFTVQAQCASMHASVPAFLSAFQGMQLLLIDGNATRRARFCGLLKPLGIRLVQATSEPEALMFMKHDTGFDGIILDEAVAVDTSYQDMISTLRDAGKCSQLPVIVLCAFQRDVVYDRRLAQSATYAQQGNVTLLWKPIKQASLYQALQVVFPKPAKTLSVESDASEPVSALTSGAALLPVPLSAAATPKPAVPRTPDEIARRAALKILIAEDNRINQRVALRLLELLGYQADVVSSGKDVLAALKRQTYDVILMDMRMPELDGLEATRQIRQSHHYEGLWIIAMTANAMEKDRQRCLAAGMDDYLSKPIKREALDIALQNAPVMRTGALHLSDR